MCFSEAAAQASDVGLPGQTRNPNENLVLPNNDVRRDVNQRRRVGQSRIDRDTPSLAAITVVAPGVRFNTLAIFVTPSFAFAIVFI